MKKILNIFVCILCALSFPFLTLILSVYTNSICLKIGLIISFLFGIYIVIKNYRSNAKRINIYILILSLITATYFAIYYSKSVLTGNNFVIIFQYLTRHNFGQALLKNIRLLFCIAAIPALSYIYYYLYGFLINVSKKFYSSLLKIEKKYLLLIFLIGGFLTIILLSLTALFDCPKVNNTVRYDILYTTDSSILSLDNSLDINNLQNDIRQPLYGIFSVPILMPISLLCKVLSFNDINFSIISTIFQLLLLSISTILLSRMMNLKEKK